MKTMTVKKSIMARIGSFLLLTLLSNQLYCQDVKWLSSKGAFEAFIIDNHCQFTFIDGYTNDKQFNDDLIIISAKSRCEPGHISLQDLLILSVGSESSFFCYYEKGKLKKRKIQRDLKTELVGAVDKIEVGRFCLNFDLVKNYDVLSSQDLILIRKNDVLSGGLFSNQSHYEVDNFPPEIAKLLELIYLNF